MRGVERVWVLLRQEALRSGSSVALKDKEANALKNLARLTSLVQLLAYCLVRQKQTGHLLE